MTSTKDADNTTFNLPSYQDKICQLSSFALDCVDNHTAGHRAMEQERENNRHNKGEITRRSLS